MKPIPSNRSNTEALIPLNGQDTASLASLRSPLAWYGSKSRLVPHLIKLCSPHTCYVEVFGGSGALLFGKPSSPVEVFNDLHNEVVHFFQTLRGRNGTKLIRQLEMTPHAREEHANCKRSSGMNVNDVERARRFFVAACQSYSGIFRDAYSTSKKKPMARTWAGRVGCLPSAIERLRNVQIEALDFRRLLPKYDSPETLFYCDPPYLHSTRTANAQGKACRKYTHEMTEQDHQELLTILLKVKGKVMVSGYGNSLYDRTLRG